MKRREPIEYEYRPDRWRRRRRGAAVHDRNFRTIDFDGGVVDAHAAQRGQDMLGGGDQRTFAVAKNGGEFGGDHGFGGGLDFAVATIQSGADKNKTRIHRCGSEGQIDRKTGMNADAGHGGLRPKRCLPAKFHPKTAHYRLTQRSERSSLPRQFALSSFPKSRQTIALPQRRANSRFFTDCYPISAVFAPKLNQIRHLASTARHASLTTKYIINHLISVACVQRARRLGPKKGPGCSSRDLLSSRL